MTQIEQIRAEIERLMKWKPKAIPSGMRQRDVLNIRKGVLLNLKDFINSLEVKEVDLEKELKVWMEFNVDNTGYFNTLEFAKHFFELGIISKDENKIPLKWNKQSEKDILNSFNDLKIHHYICLMCNGNVCEFTGKISDKHDGIINKCLIPDNPGYSIKYIVYWAEITDLKYKIKKHKK